MEPRTPGATAGPQHSPRPEKLRPAAASGHQSKIKPVTSQGDYDLVLTPPARRALAEKLPESIATAVIEFLTTALIREPQRVGKPPRDDLAGPGPRAGVLTAFCTASARTSAK